MKRDADLDFYVGSRIRQARLQIGMSRSELGHAIGVASQQIRLYETGQQHISARRLTQISDALRVGIGTFFMDPIVEPADQAGVILFYSQAKVRLECIMQRRNSLHPSYKRALKSVRLNAENDNTPSR